MTAALIMKKHAGFTLIELLVAMVISGLVVTALAQMLWQQKNMYERMSQNLGSIGPQLIRYDRFAELIRGLYPSLAGGDGAFKAPDDRNISGMSIHPLFASDGVPTPFSLQIREAGRNIWLLQYSEGDKKLELYRWETASAPYFRFADEGGRQSDRWPALEAINGDEIPAGIILRTVRDEAPWIVYASPQGSRITRPVFKPPFSGDAGQ